MSKQLSGDIVTSKRETSLRHGGREGMARTRLLRLTREAQGAGAAGGAGLSAPVSGARALATRGAAGLGASLAFPAQGLRSQLCGLARTACAVRRFLPVDLSLSSSVITHGSFQIPRPETNPVSSEFPIIPPQAFATSCSILQ